MAMEWELSKENVQPLREGRNVEKLNACLLKARLAGASAKAKVSEEHRKMVEAIDAYVGDDPLQPWIECIKWVKESYPSGGSQSRLLQLLELCVRTFSKDKRYADDIRYLKVWINYADRCTNPKEIYSFLEDNNIGQNHALFYEHCGRYWEQQQQFSRARSIYELGIARKAQPLDYLKTQYKRFLHRALAESSSSSKDEVHSPPIGQQQSGRAFGVQIAGVSRGNMLQPTRKPNSSKLNRNTSQQFTVFSDIDGNLDISAQRNGSGKWIGESEKNKENIQQATKMKGARVPQVKQAIVAPAMELEIFRDDEEPSDNTVAVEPKKPAKERVPASRTLRHDDINSLNREEDRLKQNPLIYFEEDDLSFL